MGAPLNWIPAEVDTETPNAARVYDYLLGGAHNFENDDNLATESHSWFQRKTSHAKIEIFFGGP